MWKICCSENQSELPCTVAHKMQSLPQNLRALPSFHVSYISLFAEYWCPHYLLAWSWRQWHLSVCFTFNWEQACEVLI